MHSFWHAIFGNDNPVEVEIGPGSGTFILQAAADHPHTNFYGIEHSRSRAARLDAAIARLALRNARVLASDATCVVSRLIPPQSVSAYHVYFPDPWWKRRHHRRRLFTPAFAAALASTLRPGGHLHVATDVGDLFALIAGTVHDCAAFREDPARRSSRARPTAFERKGLARGALVRDATFVKHTEWRAVAYAHTSSAAPTTPAESPSVLRRIGVRSSSLNT
jgi:tRNA (guanine-N7-)-methyltransferase